MKKKEAEQEFNFEKAYQEILDEAKKVGMDQDVTFQTLMKEFRRMKYVCDRLYEALEKCDLVYEEESFKGRMVTKTNPIVKEYVQAHKVLVSTSETLQDTLANFPRNEDDWL